MADDLEVHLSRGEPQSIDVATASFAADDAFETDGSFDVVLRNHGAALHVYLQLDDDLSRIADLGAANHYVEEGQIRRVRVTVSNGGRPVRGRLKVVTGYGAETEYVTVSVVDAGSPDQGVVVDEELAKPQSPPAEPLIDPEQLPVVALGALALFIVLVATLAVGGLRVFVGALVVVAGIALAGALLLR